MNPAGALERPPEKDQPVERERTAPAHRAILAIAVPFHTRDQLEAFHGQYGKAVVGEFQFRIGILGKLDPGIPVAAGFQIQAFLRHVCCDLEVVDLAFLLTGGDVLVQRPVIPERDAQPPARMLRRSAGA